jgi:hypothetical protein
VLYVVIRPETIYGQKPRTQRRREEREAAKDPSPRQDAKLRRVNKIANLAVAIELYLADNDTFRAKANKEAYGQAILILKTYQEAINDPTHGTK